MTVVWIVIGVAAGLIAFFVGLFFWSNYLHVSKSLVSALCRELSIMLDAGIPLINALKILGQRTSHPKLRSIVQEIQISVENGNTVAAAMANYPAVFDEMMIGIIKVGETGGVLEQSLRRLAEHLERVIRLRRKVALAWTYPILVLLVATAVTLVLICFFIPKIIEPFKDLNPDVELPWLTQMVSNTGQYVLDHWLWLLILLILAAVGLSLFKRTPPGKRVFDFIKLHFPIVGNLLGRRVIAARVSTTFATLIQCGIPIIPCLRIVAQTQPNVYISDSFERTVREVEEGGSLVKPLENSGLYPPLMIDMLAIGDESGTLDTVLDKISQYFTEEIDAALEVFTRLLEGFLMLLVGAIVVVVALAAYLPYFKLPTYLG